MKNIPAIVEVEIPEQESSSRGGVRMLELIWCAHCDSQSNTMLTGWIGSVVHATLKCKKCHTSFISRKKYPPDTPQETYFELQKQFEIEVLYSYRHYKPKEGDVRGIYGIELPLVNQKLING